jgi:4-hydroxybenzoate polyprenyltransferase
MWNPLDPTSTNILLGLEDAARGFAAMVLAGPFMGGFSQTLNDEYNREILDGINAPYRPIPSSAISEEERMGQIWLLQFGGLSLVPGLGPAIGNDFDSIGGADRKFGFQSFPVMYGIDGANWMCAGFQSLTQLCVVAYLYSIGVPT